MKKGFKIAFFILVLLTRATFLNASGTYTPTIAEPITETWRWQNFPELSGRGCQCMVETKNGVLYFGVNGGIIQYDGVNWKYFQISSEFTDIPVVTLCLASDGTIYAGTSKGIRTFKNGKWGELKLRLNYGDPNDFPYNKFPIIETSDHSIWIGACQGVLQIKNGKINLYREDRYYIGIGNGNESYSEVKNLPMFDIYSIFEDNKGKIWFGLRDGRIYSCKMPGNDMNSKLVWHREDTERGYKQALFPIIKMDGAGRMFIASGAKDGGVNILNGSRWEGVSIRKKFNIDDMENDIITLKDGSICIGGIGRVFIVRNNVWKVFDRISLPFPSNRLRLFQTSDNSLWIIGLSNDVWRIDLSYKKWITYNGLNFLAEEKNGDRWFLSAKGSVVRNVQKTNSWLEYTTADGLIDAPVSIFVSRGGEVWVAGSHKDVAATAYFNGNGWVKQLQPRLSWGIDRRAILEAKDGSLWFGTCSDFDNAKGQMGGLVRYKRVQHSGSPAFEYEYYPSDDNFRIYGIYGIGQSGNQDIWTGQLGFYKLDHISKKWEKINKPFGLSQNFIDCIQTGYSGDIWVGTRTNGLFHFDYKTGNWKQYTTQNGLSSNSILDILCEHGGNVWIATDREISHFDGTNWTTNVFPNVFKYMRDGISIKSNGNGSIWVNLCPSVWYRRTLYADQRFINLPGEFRTTFYHPDKLSPSTEITFSMDRVAQPGNVILSWSANNPWKTTPETQIQYSYRFDNGEWSPYSGKKSEIFLAIASGKHDFEVKSRNRDMNVDTTPAHVSFYVEPPVWLEPWFILLILSFLVTITSFIVHLYHRNKIIQDLSETRARLFTNISHELRTPLTLILGSLARIYKTQNLNNEMHQPLNLIQRNSQRLLRLINQILDYRKIEAGQMKFEPGMGDIINFIHDEFLSFINEAETKKIDINFDTEIEQLDVWFDRDKVEKIMFNLLSNALKFTPSGKNININICIEKNVVEKEIQLDHNNFINISRMLVITVTDTGVGIPGDDLEKIFDRFYQVQNRQASISGGTGIGLSVAREMARIHFGEIYVESEEGVSTSFHVKLPVIEHDMIDKVVNTGTINRNESSFRYQKADKAEVENNEEDDRKSRILIVEDNTDMRLFIKGDLEADYNVMEGVDGKDGFEKAISFGPDLIISDIMMPRMDGTELCKKIKADERTSHISVILLTARSSRENMLAGLEIGADDYLGKPFDSDELKLRIRNIIETRKKIREKFNGSVKIEPKSIPITSVDQKLIERAIQIIEEHMDDSEFSVEIFSSLLGMNRVSLHYKLKSLTDMSPREFYTMIRLKRAEQLLKESGLTITEITYQVGFKDPSHFSKLFKKQFGMSPKEYIKNLHGE